MYSRLPRPFQGSGLVAAQFEVVEGKGFRELPVGIESRFAGGGGGGLLKRSVKENTKVWQTFVFQATNNGFKAEAAAGNGAVPGGRTGWLA